MASQPLHGNVSPLFIRYTSFLIIIKSKNAVYTPPFRPACSVSFKSWKPCGKQIIDSKHKTSRSCSTSLFESEGLCQNIASTKVIGLCIGCLPAAAYAYSSCLEDLESIAVPVTCIAFRVGYQATTGAQSYYGRQLISEPCSMIVSSNTQESVSKALKEHAANTVPSAGCYISAVAHSSVTVSGRPAALENVRQSLESLKGKTVTRIPVHAPYHAPHIHRDVDAQWLLCGNQLKTKSLLERFQRGLPLLSTSSGKQMSADSLYVALDSCIKDILISQLRWDCLVQEVVTEMQRGHQNCEIMMIGPSGADAGLSSALRSIANVETVLKRPDFTFLPDAENVREPLAIVGMAGRFPDADSTEEFWQNLESGLDSHREVQWRLVTLGHCISPIC